ncbi:hypothetical protein RND81_07G048800 [Saponaria officinalis]|uniref:Uncharacterized protein n=1 Tax=Saponaria officinalis TaxID=3572 RepID=A0AAW1JLX0_SAPOF
MVSTLSKDNSSNSSYPRALSSIMVSFALLAIFISLASWILLSHPVGSIVRSYFNEVDVRLRLGSQISKGTTEVDESRGLSVPSGNDTVVQKLDIMNPEPYQKSRDY